MKSNEFEVYAKILYEKSGLVIKSEKSYLLESRLIPVAKTFGLESLTQLSEELSRPAANQDIITAVVEAMTTNETSFFRDQRPFERLAEYVLPRLMEKRPMKRLRLWCAAASTGQEPYTISIVLRENEAKFPGLNCEIMATDISKDVLQTAEEGIYSQFEVQRGLPIQLLIKYFEQNGEKWHLKPDIKQMVKFKYFNLLEDMKGLGNFDIIFCRNVLIYFDQETKADVLNRMYALMPNDGFLFLGGAETVLGITDKFKPVKGERGLYVPHDTVYDIV